MAGTQAAEYARQLVARFGSALAVIEAAGEPDLLERQIAAAIRGRLVAHRRSVADRLRREAVAALRLGSLRDLVTYLRFDMAGLRREQFRVLLLDAANRLIGDEVLWRGTVDRVQVHPREVVRLALSEGAIGIIAVHNHVGGTIEPSAQDVETTSLLVRSCLACGLTLTDHLIVGLRGCFSMRAAGLLQSMESRWTIPFAAQQAA